MTPIDLLVFDFDGTLVDTKHDIAFSVNLSLEELGLPQLPETAIFGYVGKGVENLMTQALRATSRDNKEQDIGSSVTPPDVPTHAVTNSRSMTPIDLLVFDFDGTLVDTKHDIAFSVNLSLEELGLPQLPETAIFGYVGKGVENLMTQALQSARLTHSTQGPDQQLTKKTSESNKEPNTGSSGTLGVTPAGPHPGETGNQGIAPTDPAYKAEHQQFEYSVTLFKKHYEQHLMDRTVFFPHCREMLRHFSDKKKIVLSNKPERFIRIILEELGSLEEFDAIAGGDTYAKKKPDPMGLLDLMSQFNVAPERVLMVGDSQVDIDTARAAGVKACGVTYGHATSEEMTALKPDFIINDLAELKPHFSL